MIFTRWHGAGTNTPTYAMKLIGLDWFVLQHTVRCIQLLSTQPKDRFSILLKIWRWLTYDLQLVVHVHYGPSYWAIYPCGVSILSSKPILSTEVSQFLFRSFKQSLTPQNIILELVQVQTGLEQQLSQLVHHSSTCIPRNWIQKNHHNFEGFV